jgi:hypothetical protein
MLVAHLFLKTGPQPIMLTEDKGTDTPPFHALEALVAAGCSAAQALRILSARRARGSEARLSMKRWQRAEPGLAGRYGHRQGPAGAKPAGH